MKKGTVLIVVADRLNVDIVREGLEPAGFELKRIEASSDQYERVIEAAQGCCAIIAAMEPWNHDTISRVKDSVKMIIRYGAGYNNVDIAAATSLGMPIFNAAGLSSTTVAEVALLHIMNALREFSLSVEHAKAGTYMPDDMRTSELTGKTVGLMGAGAIARELVKMMASFKVKVLAYDPYPSDAARELGVEFVASPEELFPQCDVISIHTPLNKDTEGLIDYKLMCMMKPTAVLVNTSRGPVVNEKDIIRALNEKRFRAAGLDVVCDEPIKPDNPLLSLPNAYVTTHIGATAYEAKVRVEKCLASTVVEFFAGKYDNAPPFNLINPDYVKNL